MLEYTPWMGGGSCEYRYKLFYLTASGDEVAVNKIGDIVILMPKENKWSGFLSSLNLFSEDFMSGGREEEIPQKRDAL